MSAGPGTMSDLAVQSLSLVDELVLTLLDEESGYFRQVAGWNLNCTIVGGALADLSLRSRIDTDLESMILLDPTATGDPVLDLILREVAAEPEQWNAQYWIERLAPRAEKIIDLVLERLVESGVLQYHEGGFWSLTPIGRHGAPDADSGDGTAAEFVKERLRKEIFSDEVPDLRDAIIVSLIESCGVLRFIFDLDEEAEKRVEAICRIDLIGRAIAGAVDENIAGRLFRPSALTKSIPVVPLRRLLRSPHVRDGNLPALVAGLAAEYGPVFELRLPLRERMIVLAGPETNRWMHRHGRTHLRARDYLEDFEKIYGGSAILPALDGGDHFRYRRAMQPSYSRTRLEHRLDEFYPLAREHMATWTVGETLPAVGMCRRLVNAEMSPLAVGIDSQDVVDDLHKFKERALRTHIGKTLPKFMLFTPGMRRRAKLLEEVVDRIHEARRTAEQEECPRDLADDLLNLHTNDCLLLPEANLRFVLSAPMIASLYVGDQLAFAVHALLSQPALLEKIRGEADALFEAGDPDRDSVTGPAADVTRRFLMECMRLHPTVPMSARNVDNSCVVEGYELPVGAQILVVSTATHFMSDVFPDPFSFDIDRYLAPRNEHVGTGYAPYGLGTHGCLGWRWTELQLLLNLLMLAHHFTLRIAPKNYELRISPFPTMSPNRKLGFTIAGRRREIPSASAQ